MADLLFTKIINREIPAEIVYEDDQCLAFKDIHPQAPLHVLLIPKKLIPKLADAGTEDLALLGHLLLTAPKIAAAQGFGEHFRVVVNNGEGSGQAVFHLHLHILGGRAFAWPPG